MYFKVESFGKYWRVIDYEGYPIGAPFERADSAQSYADALNEARRRRVQRETPPLPRLTLACVPVEPRPTMRERLQALTDKMRSYRAARRAI